MSGNLESPQPGALQTGRERRLWNERIEAMPRDALRALQ